MTRRTPPSVAMIAQIVREAPTPNNIRASVAEATVLNYMSNVLACLRSTASAWLQDAVTAPDSPLMLVDVGADGVEHVLTRHEDYEQRRGQHDEHSPGWAYTWAPASTVPDLDLMWINDKTGGAAIRNRRRASQIGGRFVLTHESYQQYRALYTQRIAGQRAIIVLTDLTERRELAGDGDPAHHGTYHQALLDVSNACFAEPADNWWLPTMVDLYQHSLALETAEGKPHQPTYRRALADIAARVLGCSPADARPLLENILPTTTPQEADHGFHHRL